MRPTGSVLSTSPHFNSEALRSCSSHHHMASSAVSRHGSAQPVAAACPPSLATSEAHLRRPQSPAHRSTPPIAMASDPLFRSSHAQTSATPLRSCSSPSAASAPWLFLPCLIPTSRPHTSHLFPLREPLARSPTNFS
ncbi:uncharacterized protein PFL1_00829 [Pseudozyma flocculosa PF-1]|uniref:uncharacterized protein n=1 Tax=Pseudozyma flocculosa PF-1 TaxID=1277687 RepID=UPI00045604C1|nr:uncharacterized protein PFL1_00829 [Pseudozyma flocculosa PF-1]EPQ31494.1 hypothetical protein PFL1_00829 [Pseudozyma flocculosa PF-1]